MCISLSISTYIYIHMYICIYIYICTYTDIHVYTYTDRLLSESDVDFLGPPLLGAPHCKPTYLLIYPY